MFIVSFILNLGLDLSLIKSISENQNIGIVHEAVLTNIPSYYFISLADPDVLPDARSILLKFPNFPRHFIIFLS